MEGEAAMRRGEYVHTASMWRDSGKCGVAGTSMDIGASLSWPWQPVPSHGGAQTRLVPRSNTLPCTHPIKIFFLICSRCSLSSSPMHSLIFTRNPCDCGGRVSAAQKQERCRVWGADGHPHPVLTTCGRESASLMSCPPKTPHSGE
jgi:hypothetical protein